MTPSIIYEPFPYVVLILSVLMIFPLIDKFIPIILDSILILYSLVVITMRKTNRGV